MLMASNELLLVREGARADRHDEASGDLRDALDANDAGYYEAPFTFVSRGRGMSITCFYIAFRSRLMRGRYLRAFSQSYALIGLRGRDI